MKNVLLQVKNIKIVVVLYKKTKINIKVLQKLMQLQLLKFSIYEENFNNLYHSSIDQIMSKEPFSSDVLNSITNDKEHGLGKVDAYYTCIDTCSTRGFELKPNHLQAHKIYNEQ